MSTAPSRWIPLESNPDVRVLATVLVWKLNHPLDLFDQVLNQVRDMPRIAACPCVELSAVGEQSRACDGASRVRGCIRTRRRSALSLLSTTRNP